MITAHRRQLEAICRQRGANLDAAMACVVLQNGDLWTIDEKHQAYPRRKRPEVALTLAEKAKNFASSAARHVAAGMPQATDQEVARRFAICETCDHFDGRACKKCGCPVVREKKFLSKLSWAGESCPVGKWGPAAD